MNFEAKLKCMFKELLMILLRGIWEFKDYIIYVLSSKNPQIRILCLSIYFLAPTVKFVGLFYVEKSIFRPISEDEMSVVSSEFSYHCIEVIILSYFIINIYIYIYIYTLEEPENRLREQELTSGGGTK